MTIKLNFCCSKSRRQWNSVSFSLNFSEETWSWHYIFLRTMKVIFLTSSPLILTERGKYFNNYTKKQYLLCHFSTGPGRGGGDGLGLWFREEEGGVETVASVISAPSSSTGLRIHPDQTTLWLWVQVLNWFPHPTQQRAPTLVQYGPTSSCH